ncbi:MAG: hypothetical protein ABF649_03235 [Bacillus sp. (in: firmicutes)]
MYLKLLLNHLDKYKELGYKKTPYSYQYNLKREILGDKIYDHYIYRGLNSSEIENLSSKLVIPNGYQEFLQEVNGVIFFEGEISLFGRNHLVKGMSRDEQTQQPKNIIEENEYATFNKGEYLLIGESYEEEIYLIDKKSNNTLAVSLNTQEVIGEFYNFPSFLEYLLNKFLL